MKELSVILVNYKNRKLTENCINSILSSKTSLNYEIIVVDNFSNDGSCKYLKEKFPFVILYESSINGGFAYANNIGAELASGKYLLLLNNDTEVFPGMFDRLFQTIKQNRSIGVIGCRAVDGNNQELSVGHMFESLERIYLQTYIKPLLEKVGFQRVAAKAMERAVNDTDLISYPDWITGAAFFLERQLYYNIGGLDENFFMYMEDEDFCKRVTCSGYKVALLNFFGYKHFCGGSTIQSFFLTKEYIKSRLLFFKRYDPENFSAIKKALYRQISVVNGALDKIEVTRMQSELDTFVQNELSDMASQICGVCNY